MGDGLAVGHPGRRPDDRRSGAGRASERPAPGAPACQPACQRCGFEVPALALGCKNPCPNCGTVYPLGDCSD